MCRKKKWEEGSEKKNDTYDAGAAEIKESTMQRRNPARKSGGVADLQEKNTDGGVGIALAAAQRC